jgi:hypothetical protein
MKKQIHLLLILAFLLAPFTQIPKAEVNIPIAKALGPDIVNPLNTNIPVHVKSDDTLGKIEQAKGVQVIAFSKFVGDFLQKTVQSIEENYKISNFLYYQDALVENQYFDSYLSKYVPDNTSKLMIRTLVSQFNCGRHQNITVTLQDKARNHLGFDPATLSVNDPDYYQKVAQMGDFLSTPTGWALYLEDIGQQALGSAKDAAKAEIESPGYAAPRDAQGNIAVSIDSLVAAKTTALAQQLNIANDIPQFVASNLASADGLLGSAINGITGGSKILNGALTLATNAAIEKLATEAYKMAHKFILNGAQKIYGEKATCLGAPKVRPIIPPTETNYTPPENVPDPESLLIVEPTLLPFGGGTVSISWDLTSSPDLLPDVEKATLNGEEVALQDSRQVEVTESTAYTLIAYNSTGQPIQIYNVGVEVREPPRGAAEDAPTLNTTSGSGSGIQR